MTKSINVKETIENVLNANENARKRKKAETKNKVLIGAIPVSIGITAIVTRIASRRSFNRTINDLRDNAETAVTKAEKILDKAEEKIDSFEESIGGDIID